MLSTLNTVIGIFSGLVSLVTGLDAFIKELGLTTLLNTSSGVVKIIFGISLLIVFISIFIQKKVINKSGDSQFQFFGKKNSQTIIKK